MACGTGPIPTENRFPCETIVACLGWTLCVGGQVWPGAPGQVGGLGGAGGGLELGPAAQSLRGRRWVTDRNLRETAVPPWPRPRRMPRGVAGGPPLPPPLLPPPGPGVGHSGGAARPLPGPPSAAHVHIGSECGRTVWGGVGMGGPNGASRAAQGKCSAVHRRPSSIAVLLIAGDVPCPTTSAAFNAGDSRG